MKKIIITVIVTIVLIAPFEKAKGQQRQTVISSADFPTTNILMGINAKLSFGLWRFEPFIEIGQYFQVFEEQMRAEIWDDMNLLIRGVEYHSQRFASMQTMNIGTKFRITDRNRIILGFKLNGDPFRGVGSVVYKDYSSVYREERNAIGREFVQFYLGYSRREYLSERTSIEFSALFTPSRSRVIGNWGFGSFGGFVFSHSFWYNYGAIDVGVRLNYEIVRNLKLNVQLRYTGRFNVTWWEAPENVNNDRLITRNLLDFSVGIHYHIGRREQQQTAPRQQQQRGRGNFQRWDNHPARHQRR